MRIGTSIFLIALGAILAFAVTADSFPYFSLDVAGYILMACGVIGLIWALVAARPRSRVTETRSVADPNTGEHITRSESSDGL
ncbi:DUF6458 family protein [Tessaracoccus sp. OS52]|uniref:DUF6458 family protein n=1 Tax=Tessaracoccus sp. OS52 TaxID=2886691 RepID=UPI001D112A11|nr:DUF6458 family protein [Tessaracoccus sp. OS52]MCC2593890.1 DUF6458 family protein [Tessaracoccus sp. OS52]